MKNRFHQHAKAKPRKNSLVDFIRRFSDEDKQVKFFTTIKFPVIMAILISSKWVI